MHERHRCVDCSRLSPPTESGYTLISREFGWRLTRAKAPDGSFLLEWRCPPCWQKYKARQTAQPWEPPRRPAPRIAEQIPEDDRPLSQSGEYSAFLYEEEFPPPSSRRGPSSERRAHPSERTGPPSDRGGPPSEPVPPSNRGLPRKGS